MWKDFHPSAQTVLAGWALTVLAILSFMLVWKEPPPMSKELLLIIIGALAGALTVGGSSKLAEKIQTGDSPVMDAAPTPSEPRDDTAAP